MPFVTFVVAQKVFQLFDSGLQLSHARRLRVQGLRPAETVFHLVAQIRGAAAILDRLAES
ncbi:MAG TPA: hypothetical protein VHW03_10050 [Chthoniobacterales bacterium]|nr:hypothetical protein [Chthoniobacterales bacterium]